MDFMKRNIKTFLGTGLAVLICASCSRGEEDVRHFSNRLYIDTNTDSEEILFKSSNEIIVETRELAIATPIPVGTRVSGRFVYDPELVSAYNMSYGADAICLDASMVEIDSPEAVIEEGSVRSAETTVRFSGIESLDRNIVYVAPVHLVDVQGIGVLDSKTVVYYVFKGASLINVVADIAQNYLSVEWKSDVSRLSVVTVEALIRVRNFGKQDGKGEAMSTIFGVEDNFLVRIGDSAIESNQVQLVSNKSKFPDRNPDYGLPTDKWVHVAVVYDSNTRERIIYYDGRKITSDNEALSQVSLSGNCYVGKSFNDERWLDGCISELRVWNVHRTQEEIAANIYSVDEGSEGLLAYWKFDEGLGNDVRDHSGNGNDITASSDLKWTKVTLPEK